MSKKRKRARIRIRHYSNKLKPVEKLACSIELFNLHIAAASVSFLGPEPIF